MYKNKVFFNSVSLEDLDFAQFYGPKMADLRTEFWREICQKKNK